jgi:hypothetical protein
MMFRFMELFPGFTGATLFFENERVRVFRGTRENDGLPVILKTSQKENRTNHTLEKFQKEYQISGILATKGLTNVLELKESIPLLVTLDKNEVSLKEFLADRLLTIPEFLEIAIAITQKCSEMHDLRLIHGLLAGDLFRIHHPGDQYAKPYQRTRIPETHSRKTGLASRPLQ